MDSISAGAGPNAVGLAGEEWVGVTACAGCKEDRWETAAQALIDRIISDLSALRHPAKRGGPPPSRHSPVPGQRSQRPSFFSNSSQTCQGRPYDFQNYYAARRVNLITSPPSPAHTWDPSRHSTQCDTLSM